MTFPKKKIIKLSIIIGPIVIILWFVGNLSLYLFIKNYILNLGMETAINYRPEKLTFTKATVDAEPLHLMGLKLRFPFYKGDMKYIKPIFIGHRLDSITISLGDKDNSRGDIIFEAVDNNLRGIQISMVSKISNRILYADDSYFRFMRTLHYSSLDDFSWWRLLHNIRLANLLIEKARGIPAYGSFRVYDVETPYLKGILTEWKMFNERASIDIQFIFEWKDESLSLAFIGIDEKQTNRVRDILTTIELLDDIEKSHKEMMALYKKNKARYPDEFLLLCLISLKGATLDNLKKLLKVMKDENYHYNDIEEIKKEIAYLKR